MSNNKEQIKYRAYKFSVSLIKFVAKLSTTQVNRIIIDQLIRSATSIGANIIEAQAASSKKDFINFYQIALKSATETLYWLGIFRDTSNSNKEDLTEFIKEAQSLANILGASLLTLKNKRKL